MNITVDWLRKQGACAAGIERFAVQPERDALMLLRLMVRDDGLLDWAQWLVVRCLPDQVARVRYTVYAARLELPNYEAAYPDDRRPRATIAAARAWLKHPNDATARKRLARDLSAALAASYAARAAPDATLAASDPAGVASDAERAVSVAAGAATLRRIVRYGIRLLAQSDAAARGSNEHHC